MWRNEVALRRKQWENPSNPVRACLPLFHLWELPHWCTTNPSSDSIVYCNSWCMWLFYGWVTSPCQKFPYCCDPHAFSYCPLEKLRLASMGLWNKTHQCRPQWDNDHQKQGQWLYLHSSQSWSPQWRHTSQLHFQPSPPPSPALRNVS